MSKEELINTCKTNAYLAICVIFILITFVNLRIGESRENWEGSATASITAVEVYESDWTAGYKPTLEFRYNGEWYEVTPNESYSTKFKAGDTVTVKFRPEKPKKLFIEGHNWWLNTGKACRVGLIVLFTLGVIDAVVFSIKDFSKVGEERKYGNVTPDPEFVGGIKLDEKAEAIFQENKKKEERYLRISRKVNMVKSVIMAVMLIIVILI